jgi:hypothetical protein
MTQVHHGLLWVWPDADAALAAATPAAVIEELDQQGWSHRTQGWFARDLPLSMEAVVENVGGWCMGLCVLGGVCDRLVDKAQHFACSQGRRMTRNSDMGLLLVFISRLLIGLETSFVAAKQTAQPKRCASSTSPAQQPMLFTVSLSSHTPSCQVMDPCHANFTHHGVQGRRENEKGSQITVTSPVSPGGFQLQHATANFTADIAFQAPCFLKYNFAKFGRTMNVYVVPTKPGYCRMITKFMSDDSKPPPSAKGPMALVFKVRGCDSGWCGVSVVALCNTVYGCN